MRLAAWVVLAGFVAGCSVAQVSAQPKGRPAKTCSPLVMPMQIGIVMKDMPYSATRVLACEEKLADGTVVKGKKTLFEWRDSEGRFRRESHNVLDGPEVYYVQVIDPVEHVTWDWYVGKGSSHQAIKAKYTMRNEYAQWPTNYQFGKYLHSQGPGFKDERLRPTWVNGVYATGDRFTQICKPGQNGNKTNHPVTETSETWLSVDLGLVVESLQKNADGSSLVEDLININRAEPDPSLFKPPTGYEILESPKTGENPGIHQVKLKPRKPGKGAIVMLSPNSAPAAKH